MIIAIIFAIHLLFAVIIFTKKWQEENLSAGFTNVALIVILFAVGWTITGMVSKAIMEPKGFGEFFDRDTFSLALLTICEYFFYRFFYQKDTTANDTGKQ